MELETEKLRELDHIKSQFFANISHEFRTPLTLILGPLEQLLVETETEQIRQRKLLLMRSNAQKLKVLINQLLDLSKIESRNYPVKAAKGNLAAFLKGITMSFASQAEQQRITLELNIDPFLESNEFREQFYFDRDIFEKIINNLLSNAFKFTPVHGMIELCVCLLQEKGKNSFLEIAVKDTGPGIPEQKLPYIFDRFYQAGEDSKRDYEGSGIGLAFVKELTKLHYGEVLAKSQPDKGTIFVLRFPLGNDHFKKDEIIGQQSSNDLKSLSTTKTFPALLFSAQTHPNDSNHGLPLVLVVEDHSEVRFYVREVLQSRFRVKEASNAKEGIKQAETLIPDLIISDVMMPEMNGFAFCKIIKSNELTSHIPLIILTARGDERARLQGFENRVDDYLLKPFSPVELLMRVENLIENRRLLREKFNSKTTIKTSDIIVSSRDQVLMEKLISAVERNIDKIGFSLDDLGKEAGMSRTQLHRKMNALINQTPNQFIRSVRMNRAKELIEKDAGTIAEIAYMVGYDDPGYFSRCFRKFFDKLPSEVRKIKS